MLFKADCGVSTVLEALRVATAARFPAPLPGDTREEALRNSAMPTVGPRRRMQAGGRQIRNPKSEIPRGGQARYTRAHENR
jgi:hypothetical protein